MTREKEHNPNWPHISDHPFIILIIGGCESLEANALLNIINHQPDIDEIYLYAKDPREACDPCDSKAFIEYSNNVDDIYENIQEYKSNKEWKEYWLYLMVWLLTCLKLHQIITEFFIRGRKLNSSLVFTTQSYLQLILDLKQVRASIDCNQLFMKYWL